MIIQSHQPRGGTVVFHLRSGKHIVLTRCSEALIAQLQSQASQWLGKTYIFDVGGRKAYVPMSSIEYFEFLSGPPPQDLEVNFGVSMAGVEAI